jgi:DNA-binding NtrC family response regulator
MVSAEVTLDEAVEAVRREFVVSVLTQHRGNQCRAARAIGVHRNTMSRYIDDLNIDVRGIRREMSKRKSVRSATECEAMLRRA